MVRNKLRHGLEGLRPRPRAGSGGDATDESQGVFYAVNRIRAAFPNLIEVGEPQTLLFWECLQHMFPTERIAIRRSVLDKEWPEEGYAHGIMCMDL